MKKTVMGILAHVDAGKTTLAEFIKSMFYGLLSYKTTTKEFVSRKHYYPFNGGLFGGNIVFIYENKKRGYQKRSYYSPR